MENRKYSRTVVAGLFVDVSDGDRFFSGIVTDISQFGFCMTDIPKIIRSDAENMIVVISGHGSNFTFQVRLIWSKSERYTKTIGVQIINASQKWINFTMIFKPNELFVIN